VTIDISRWQAPPASLLIQADELHLWRFRIDISAQAAAVARQSLSADECDRADRFIKPLHQLKFTAARYGLRRILGGYLKCLPASIVFAYSQRGKPSLGEEHRTDINFNLSHSGNWALLAVTSGPDVGVDLEQIVPKEGLQQLADYAFDETEKKMFFDFSPVRKQRGFYRLWAAKEARLKMLGVGLGDVGKIAVPYYQYFFVPAKSYVAAVAVDQRVARIVRYHNVMTR